MVWGLRHLMGDFVHHFSEGLGAFQWGEGCDDNFVIV